MNNSTHRSFRKKHLRRSHPNNQVLVVDTSLGRKRYVHPAHLPALNIASLVPPTIPLPPLPYRHHHQHQQHHQQHHHQQQQRRRREGPPSPPAHLRASVIFLPVSINQPTPAALSPQPAPLLPRPVSVASSSSSHNHQCQYHCQQQQHLQPLLPHAQCAPHTTSGRPSSATSETPYNPTTTYLRTYHTRIAQHPTPKPGHRFPKHQQQPITSSTRSNRALTTLFSSSSKRLYNALVKEKHTFANQGQGEQQQRQRREQWEEHGVVPESKTEFEHENMQAHPRSFHSASYGAQDLTKPATTTTTSMATTKKKSCIHLDFAAYMITSFMLAYNGIMSVVLLQASRAPDDTNIPVFIFWLIFLFTATLAIFGFLALSLSSWTLIRVFHTMYLFTAFLTFASMLSWLAVNQSQTGTWDRILLDDPEDYDPFRSYSYLGAKVDSAPTAFESPRRPVLQDIWLKSLLSMDPTTKTWVISPWKWILAFGAIFASQCACWYYGLLAYDRQVLDRKVRDGKYSYIDDDSSQLVASEKV